MSDQTPLRMISSLRVDLTSGRLEIDGEQFPYYLADQAISVEELAANGMSAVTFTVFAETVDIAVEAGDEKELLSRVSYRRQ